MLRCKVRQEVCDPGGWDGQRSPCARAEAEADGEKQHLVKAIRRINSVSFSPWLDDLRCDKWILQELVIGLFPCSIHSVLRSQNNPPFQHQLQCPLPFQLGNCNHHWHITHYRRQTCRRVPKLLQGRQSFELRAIAALRQKSSAVRNARPARDAHPTV